ncbi:hydroxymethylbilane synthase [Planosporangium mesophilum]|uniref:hydroxymethylbilane synthase n=1 Tax=Planosporangium mesophilum TaxID=689768 RepID=UPI00143AE2DC|nr:hydroxymethylbilane synthase [Planosporangium mesophilum]NJC81027.1 hydroxymethylbilane synthase [Planosporangium mesophilum]
MYGKLRLGTRGSALAMAQSGLVAAAVRAKTGREVELVEISTAGDRSSAPIANLGVGVFVSALRDALAAKEIDFAVHSYKDLPTSAQEGPGPRGSTTPRTFGDGLCIAAVPPREDPRDALVARDGLTLTELSEGARIGTGAIRRIAQIAALGRNLKCVPIRGNVDTRLRKVAQGELDGVILARAGLSRLGRAAEATEILDPMLMLPAPAQGALAVECREDDDELIELLAALDDPGTRAAVTAERALLAQLEAGCSAPVAALAEIAEGDSGLEIYLRGAVFSPDGRFGVRLSRTGTLAEAGQVGRLLATDLLAEGADSVLGSTA